jgi:hypothetical protein
MRKFRLISVRRGRAFVPIEEKIRAVAEIFVKERARDEVLGPIYERAGRPLPENTSVVLQNWKRAIQDKLDRNDQYTIDLCQKFQIVEEVPDESAATGHASAREG